MNKKKQEILRRVERMIERLEQPQTPEEARREMLFQDTKSMLAYYRRLREDLLSGKRVWRDPGYYSVSRGLDSWGYADTELGHEACNISTMIWNYSSFNQLDFVWDRIRICFSRRRP